MKKKLVYLVGIKGVAITSLAVYLKEKGYEVTGSDVEDTFPTDKILKEKKIKIKKGFSEKNIDNIYQLTVVTGAHGGMTNVEAQKAKEFGIPTYMHGEFLGKLMEGKFGISIAGCHGKTTTSSLIAFLLQRGGFNPSYAIGTAEINGLGPAGHFGSGKIFVAEADEYVTCPQTDPTPRFMWQNPKILVLTNIEYDHPDVYANIEEVKMAYRNFIQKLGGDTVIVACIDNENVSSVLAGTNKKVITYGFSPAADFRISHFYFNEGISFMQVMHKNIGLGEYMLQISGKHNLLNSLAGIIVAQQLGMGNENIKRFLKLYTGCKRRFEKISQVKNVLFYDDYAHHPSEITATLLGAREWFKTRRIIVIFQPHTFSRTKALLSDFAKSFLQADIVLMVDIYPSAREKKDNSINSKMIVIEANKNKKNALYLDSKEKALNYLAENISSNDLIITMGAGDIYTWHNDMNKLFVKN